MAAENTAARPGLMAELHEKSKRRCESLVTSIWLGVRKRAHLLNMCALKLRASARCLGIIGAPHAVLYTKVTILLCSYTTVTMASI